MVDELFDHLVSPFWLIHGNHVACIIQPHEGQSVKVLEHPTSLPQKH